MSDGLSWEAITAIGAILLVAAVPILTLIVALIGILYQRPTAPR